MAGKNLGSTVEGRASQTLNKMSELRLHVEVWTQTLGGECAKVSGLFEVELCGSIRSSSWL